MRIFVTGAGSSFARALLPALCAHPSIAGVTAIDPGGVGFQHPKLSAAALDIRDPALPPLLAGHDALVHLGCAAPGKDTADMFDLNVRCAHKLFHAARSAGMTKLIHMSTALVYGPAVHAAEHSALKPLPGFTYAEHQAQLEQMLAIEFPECVRLRPHVIVGPHAHPVVRKVLRQPFYLRFPEPQPLLQCVHEDDVAQALLLCLEKPARGPYNLAVEESVSLRDAIRARFGFGIGITANTARATLERAARLLHWDFDAAWLDRLSHTLLVNSRRAMIDLGWRARYGVREALRTT